LRELVNRLQTAFKTKNIAGEVVLVDDGSKDGAEAIVDQPESEHPKVIAVPHGTNRGMVAGWRSGLEVSHGDLVCLIDSDLQNLPEDVCRLYREINLNGADIVQGFRSSVGRLRDSRYFLSKTLNFILNTCFGMRLRGNKSSIIILLRKVLVNIFRHRVKYYYFQALIMISAASALPATEGC
jgi:phenylacetate-CoA ligase